MSAPLTDDELRALRQAIADHEFGWTRLPCGHADGLRMIRESRDAAFAALPRLLDEVERLRARVAELESYNGEYWRVTADDLAAAVEADAAERGES